MTIREVDELERLEKAATKGPWAVDHDRREGGVDQLIEVVTPINFTIAFGTSDGNECDLPFLAAARNATPRLISDWRRMREALERIATEKCTYGAGIDCAEKALAACVDVAVAALLAETGGEQT